MGQSPQAKDLGDAFVTAPGSYQEILNYIPGSTFKAVPVDATFKDFVDTNSVRVEATFPVAIAAKYKFTIRGIAKLDGTTTPGIARLQVQPVFDQGGFGGFTAQTKGPLSGSAVYGGVILSNQSTSAADRGAIHVVGEVELAAGTHQITIQARADLIIGGISAALDESDWLTVSLERISGSGLGGEIIGYQNLVGVSDNVSTVGYADVIYSAAKAWSVSIEAQAGEKIVVEWHGNGRDNTGACQTAVKINHEGVGLIDREDILKGASAAEYRSASLKRVVVAPTTGTHTFTLQASQTVGSDFAFISGAMLIRQMRGGNHEWRDVDGNVITNSARYVQVDGSVPQIQDDGGLKLTQPAAVTAPGSFIQALFVQPASTFSIAVSAAAYADIVDTDSVRAEGLFTAPIAGEYKFTVRGFAYLPNAGAAAISSLRLRPVFDQGGYGGFTEQIVNPPSTEAWQHQMSSIQATDYQRTTIVFHGTVTLAAGVHQITLQGERTQIVGTQNPTIPEDDYLIVTMEPITGSGAGGILVDEYVLDQNFSTTSATFVPVDGSSDEMEIAVTTVKDERVLISGKLALAITSGSGQEIVGVGIDGADPANAIPGMYGQSGGVQSAYAFGYLSPAMSAGSHTFRVMLKAGGGTTVRVGGGAGDQGSFFQVSRYRGGLIPEYDKDGTLINDKPNSRQYGEGLRVVNAGGRSVVTGDFAAAGMQVDSVSSIGADFSQSSTGTWETVAGGDKTLTKTISLAVAQWVIVAAHINSFGATADHESAMRVDIDGTVYGSHSEDVDNTIAPNSQRKFGVTFPVFLEAGSHTIKVEVKTFQPTVLWKASDDGLGLFITRFQGGYTIPENVPQLEYSSASAVSIAKAPGADDEGRVTLNDGIRRRAVLPLSVSLAGGVALGGLDAGTEAADTWYNIFAVPSGVAGEFDVVASTALSSVGPAGYAAWRHLGWMRNDGSSDILKFYQASEWFYYEVELTVLDTGSGDLAVTDLDISEFIPPSATLAQLVAFVITGQLSIYVKDATARFFNADDSGLADLNCAIIPTPGSPKEIRYAKTSTPGASNIRCHGWYDGELGSSRSQAAPARRSDEWNYLDLVKPTGVSASIEALWQFDQTASDLLDRTANAHDLALVGTDFHTVVGGLKARLFDGSTTHLTRVIDAGLRMLGVLTMEILVVPSATINDSAENLGIILSHADPAVSDASSVSNILYQVNVQSIAGLIGRLGYDSENATGSNSSFAGKAGLPTGQFAYVAVTRDGSGNVGFHVNAKLLDTGSTTLPTDGSTGRLVIGAEGVSDVRKFFCGAIAAIRLTPEEFTVSQLEEVYDRLRGRIL